MSVSPAHVARISGPGGYCSGTLIGPDAVLTCGHFFTPASPYTATTCAVAGTRRRIAHLKRFPGTDIALARLTKPVDGVDEYPDFGPAPLPLVRTVTLGFGGGATTPQTRVGRLVTGLPLAISRGLTTVVRPAALIINTPRAIKGDSGGPVLFDGRIFGVQSLILDPFGRNLGVATVSVVTPAIVEKLGALR